jgi:ubiquinone/menaquinone biosynthesis C-methylase UbiE
MDSSASFTGSIAENYEKYLVPIFFEPYSKDIADRLPAQGISSLLEIACGTGQVTRVIAGKLPHIMIAATDLNPDMITIARKQMGEKPNIVWKTADAQELPYNDNEFDCAVCQFGLMFIPDRQKSINETYRVIRKGGKYIFNTWDSMQNNSISMVAHKVTNSFFPDNPITFWHVPFSMYNSDEMKSLMQKAGFTNISVTKVSCEGHSISARDAAIGLTAGTPVYVSLCERGIELIPAIQDKLTEAITEGYGASDLRFPLSAWVTEGTK